MTKPVVTGDSLEGQIGNLHEEDVVLEFAGSRPDQLVEGCYYEGTVDGYADFGVFVDVGDHVTGLLHRSELPRRLESLNWDVGDVVYVKVKNVRDNGNVDLGWSIRESEREFRGAFVHDPEGRLEGEREREEEGDEERAEKEPDEAERTSAAAPGGGGGGESTTDGGTGAEAEPARAEARAEPSAAPDRVAVGSLSERIGETVRLEGVVTSARQTSGPTVFEVQDETGTVDCAAFEEAGVRAYPEADAGDLVQIDGEVRERRGELQVETERLVVLEDEAAARVTDRMDAALEEEASAPETEPLADDPAVESVLGAVREAATAIRRAIIEERPVIVRHDASVDGYLAGAALERAVLPLVREEHVEADAAYHYFDRRPLETVYDMDDATGDVTSMLSNRERHDEKLPLFVFAGAGRTVDSLDGLDLLDVYGVERVVIDVGTVDEAVIESVDAVVAPDGETSSTAVASAVALHVNDDDAVREAIRHLPAASVWEDAPESYRQLAAEAGHDDDRLARLREAIALEAYYQSYEDKRELVEDLLFDGQAGLVEQTSEQFREKITAEIDTAEANLERRERDGVRFAVLDTDAFTHRFDFPPTDLLLDEVHRRERGEEPFVTLGVGDDDLWLHATASIDAREVADAVAERVPNAGVSARGGENRLVFVTGEREAVRDATLDVVAEQIEDGRGR